MKKILWIYDDQETRSNPEFPNRPSILKHMKEYSVDNIGPDTAAAYVASGAAIDVEDPLLKEKVEFSKLNNKRTLGFIPPKAKPKEKDK